MLHTIIHNPYYILYFLFTFDSRASLFLLGSVPVGGEGLSVFSRCVVWVLASWISLSDSVSLSCSCFIWVSSTCPSIDGWSDVSNNLNVWIFFTNKLYFSAVVEYLDAHHKDWLWQHLFNAHTQTWPWHWAWRRAFYLYYRWICGCHFDNVSAEDLYCLPLLAYNRH